MQKLQILFNTLSFWDTHPSALKIPQNNYSDVILPKPSQRSIIVLLIFRDELCSLDDFQEHLDSTNLQK